MASTCKFFDEDAVYRINKRKLVDFGLVLENSEFISSDEEESDEKNMPEWDRMKRGHVRVAWHPKGAEEVLPERKVKLFDRSLMPGDVVRKLIKGKDTQLGYCRNTSVKACVQMVGTKEVIAGVNSKDMIPMEEFSSDIAVFLNSWVGMVKAVKSEIAVKCSDGSRGTMCDIDAFDLDDILDRRDRASEYKKYSFYPGQQLWGPSFCFENVKWANLNKEMKEILAKPSRSIRITVEDVNVVSLGVQWVCRAYCEDSATENVPEQPNYYVLGEDLKKVQMMNIFEHCALQIGNRNFLIIKETDRRMTLDEWKREMSLRLIVGKDLNSPGPKKKNTQILNENKENVVDGICTEQNGLYENDSEFEDIDDDEDDGNSSDSASITSHSTASSVDKSKSGYKHKSKRGPSLATKVLRKKKVRRARRNLLREVLPIKPGDKVVTETLVIETNADVVWQDGSIEEDIPSSNLYPIHHLDGHEFFPGDFVIESKDPKPLEYGVIQHVDHSGRTASVRWMKTYHAGADPHPETLLSEEVSVYDIKDHPDFRYRPGSCVIRVANFEDSDPSSTAGQVVDIHPTGKVEVSWVSGRMSFCYPQELYRVGEYDSDDLWGDDDTFGDEEDSWETESEGSIVGIEEGCQALEKGSEEENIAKNRDKETVKSPDKEEEKSVDDTKSIQEKLLANIEKLRAGMARLEEVFTQNPDLLTCNVMKRLLELYKNCKVLDQLLGTTYFHEKHLQALVDQLRQRGRVNSLQHMADQISRLFSIQANDSIAAEASALAQTADDLKSCLESTNDSIAHVTAPTNEELDALANKSDNSVHESDGLNSKLDLNIESNVKNSSILLSPVGLPWIGNSNEPRNICQQLCTMLKTRLLKAHENVERRFGMSPNTATLLAADDSSPKHEKNDVSTQSDLADLNDGSNDASTKDLPTTVVDEKLTDKEDGNAISTAGQGVFSILESVPDSHKYKLSILQPTDPRAFFKTVKKEMQLLNTSLPEGIVVTGFEDRIDLYSVMIKGPKRTPYEDGLFFFDFQLPADYPKAPPLCHYISYCSDRLNPNLYEGGKVCVSLLGTWGGKGTEVWSSTSSNLLQVIVSIQGLILVSEPYFNEAGYERQRGTQQGRENSRMYNEMVVLKLVQAMSKLMVCLPEVFKEYIIEHFSTNASRLITRLEHWLTISEEWNTDHPTSPTSPTIFKEMHSFESSNEEIQFPEFPLIPASKGFCLTLRKSLANFKEVLTSSDILLS